MTIKVKQKSQASKGSKYTFDKTRPLSWSSISAFEYDRDAWFRRYYLGETTDSAEMRFGKLVADSFGTDKPLAPVTRYSVIEQKLSVMFGKIPLIGYMDTFEPIMAFGEYKTGKKPWDQKRANEHGQLKMYALMLYITHRVKPEDIKIFLEWIPTQDNGDFSISFVKPIKIHHFDVKLTTRDVLNFGSYIMDTYKEMERFVNSHE